MAESILFMLSSVITARFLDKRKMRVASVGYLVMFIIILCLLVFALDIPLFGMALTNLCGKTMYDELHITALKVVNKSFYGISIITLIALSIAVQLGIAMFDATRKIVCNLKKRAFPRRFIKVYFHDRIRSYSFDPYLSINRLYCRMLD